jgi:predicted nucleotidyltransferase
MRQFRIHRAMAFGSYARGDMHEFSDLDLLIVGDFDLAPRLRERALREVAWAAGIEIPLQLVAYTPAEVEKVRERPFGSVILSEAVEVPLPCEGERVEVERGR